MPVSDPLPPLFDEFPPVPTEAWDEKIRDDLGRTDVADVLEWDSLEGVSLPGYLRREDLDEIPHAASALTAAETMPANDWQVRQDLAHPTPDEANRLARSALRRGATALGLVRPSSQPGRAFGLTLDTIDDLRSILDGIPLDEAVLHLDGGPTAPLLLAALQALASERGIDELSGSVGYDPVASLAMGVLRDEDRALALADDLVSAAPSGFRSITVDLRPYHDAGASATQELAFGLGALSDLLARLLDRGHDLSGLLPRLQWSTAVSTSYFVEIAKLRALRLLVPQVVAAFADEADQSIELDPTDLYVQAETSRRTETIYDPHVNMLRATTEGMAAVIGGCDVLSVRPYDASLRAEDAFGTRIARNVQLILRDEAHLDAVADPGAGAYYVEAATDQLAQRAWNQFQNLEADGGLIDGLREGHVQEEIETVRDQRRRKVDTRERVLVGTNHYPAIDETRRKDLEQPPSVRAPDSSVALDAPTVDAFRAALTDGRTVSDLLAALAPGENSIEPLPRIRVATNIENIRLRTERYAEETGHTPTVVLAPLGPAKMRSARANFARNVFGVAGFDVVEPLRFETPADAAEAAAQADADVVVLCSADREYPNLTPALKSALTDHGLSPLLLVAGNPDKIDADLPADDFIHQGNLLREKLEALQFHLGIPINDDRASG
jgi:methylmalonyl-CoA mutase